MAASAHPRRSAGLLLYRPAADGIEVLIAHTGGPFWARKDERAWSLPKGEYGDDGDAYAAARREFTEELGSAPPDGEPLPLGEVRQAGGKIVVAWALAGDLDVTTVRSNEVAIEWPPRSGRTLMVPEIDRAAWFTPEDARPRLFTAQTDFLDRLLHALGEGSRYRVSHARPAALEDQ